MKKFFAAVACCALLSMNVMAQQPAPVAGDIVEAPVNLSVVETPDSDATLVSAVQEAAPAATPVPDVTVAPAVEAAPTVVGEVAAPQGVVTEGYAPVEMTLAPYQDQTFTAAPYAAAPFAAPIQSGCGCGQAAPVMNYDAGVSYGAPIQAGADCGCAAAPAVDCCCEAGRTRPQVGSRVRGRATSVRGRGRIGSRRNNDCCCN